jgi:tryptophan synthase alpha chain
MTLRRIDDRFRTIRAEGRTALVVYLTVGDPSVEDSYACALAAIRAGADIVELGVPFSDPTADGPVIAAASYRAIHQGGSLQAVLDVASRLRKETDAILVPFSYVNPIVAYGEARFPAAAAAAGADALLIVDLPPEEGAELRAAAKAADVGMIPLVTPTTGREREALLVQQGSGFVYYVSVTGVTGTKAAPLEEAAKAAAGVRARGGLPVVVGFGIRSPEQARSVAKAGVDGIVVGTEVVRTIAEAPDRAARVERVSALVAGLRSALDAR